VAQTATNNLANAKNKSTEEAKKEAEALENLRNALAAVNPEYANLALEGDSAREKLINLKTVVEGLSEEELVKLKSQLNKANKSFKNT
jgi:hypothetical protein